MNTEELRRLAAVIDNTSGGTCYTTGGTRPETFALAKAVPSLLDEIERKDAEVAALRRQIEAEASRLRDVAERFLYDGDRDQALPGYVEAFGVADALAALSSVPDVPAARDDQPRGLVDAATIYACLDAGHDVGLRHEDGSLYSATCHDCGHRYHRNCPPAPAARDEPEPERRCDDRAPTFMPGGPPLFCVREPGHGGWHEAEPEGHGMPPLRWTDAAVSLPSKIGYELPAEAFESGPVQVTTPEDKR